MVQGKTIDGKGIISCCAAFAGTYPSLVFTIPQTRSVLYGLFHTPKSVLDLVVISSLLLQILVFSFISLKSSRYLFLAYFATWRVAYNAGLGFVLRKQSESQWIVRFVRAHGWLDDNHPVVRNWVKRELQARQPEEYNFEVSQTHLTGSQHHL